MEGGIDDQIDDRQSMIGSDDGNGRTERKVNDEELKDVDDILHLYNFLCNVFVTTFML